MDGAGASGAAGFYSTGGGSAGLGPREYLPGDLPRDAAVAWSGEDDPDLRQWHGHPGRVNDGAQEDVLVTWHGLEGSLANTVCYDVEALTLVSDEEYERRAERIRAGLHPVRDESLPAST